MFLELASLHDHHFCWYVSSIRRDSRKLRVSSLQAPRKGWVPRPSSSQPGPCRPSPSHDSNLLPGVCVRLLQLSVDVSCPTACADCLLHVEKLHHSRKLPSQPRKPRVGPRERHLLVSLELRSFSILTLVGLCRFAVY